MNRILPALFLLLPALALAQVTQGPSITGTTVPVNDGPGDQTDPHVSGDWIAYTSELNGTSEIRYHDLAQSTDAAIPSNGGLDFLSDISGSTLVYTHVTNASAIYLYDVAAGGSPTELEPQAGSNRREGRIGGGTVVWQDFAFTGDLSTPELVAYELANQTATRLTNDALLDKDPAVSPDGSVVVWTKCQTNGTGCHIFQASLGGAGWTTTQLTSGAEEARDPDTNGQWVVYSATRTQPDGTEDEDIYWQPVGGGTEHRLELPDRQTNPNISGNLIAFEGFDSTAVLPNFDIYLFDLSTQTLYRLTQTPEDETLNDISVAGGTVNVVWTKSGSDYDVFAFTFDVPAAPGNGGSCDPQAITSCDDPGTRPLVASLEVDRVHGEPFWQKTGFSSAEGDGLVCVQNGSTGLRATAGAVAINGDQVIRAWAFFRSTAQIETHVQLAADNELGAVILGKPGSGFHVSVYGPVPGCDGSASDDDGSDPTDGGHHHHHHHPHFPGHGWTHQLTGTRVIAIDSLAYAIAPAAQPVAAGCNATGTDAAAGGLLALLALVLLGARRPAKVRVPAAPSRRR